MADGKLNFNPDDLGAFDRAPDPNDALAAFDAASGVTVLPPGWYVCRVERGELVTTRKGKQAYRLRFAVVEPAAHAGFLLWKYYLLTTNNEFNIAKNALVPLGIRTGPDLQRAFPPAGRAVTCRVLVALQRDDPSRNDVERFELLRDEPDTASAVNRFLLDPNTATGEGGNP
jgi:hypothetical protein